MNRRLAAAWLDDSHNLRPDAHTPTIPGDMDRSAVWDVLKWVLAVLAAGFVGQFGRSLALRIIERKRARRENHAMRGSEEKSVEEDDKRLRAQQKIEKKRAKRALKESKKRSG